MDQCETDQYIVVDENVKELVRKTTGWLTNSRCIAEELAAFQCRNRFGQDFHKHGVIQGGRKRTERTGEYTPRLVAAILRGFRRQLQEDLVISVKFT